MLQVVPELETGGVERTAVDIARALVEAGGVALVASAGGRLVPELEAAGARHFTLPLASKNPLRLWRNAGRLAALAEREGAGIIHARSRAPAWSALWAARRLGLPFVTTYHGTYSEGFPLKRFYNSVMARGDTVIANSAFIAAHIARTHGLDPARIVTIPRGTDLSQFDPGAIAPGRCAALRAAWRLPEAAGADLPLILLPGRLTRWKGQSVFIDALARLAAEDFRFHAVIVGDAQGRDDYVAELKQQIARQGLGGAVTIAGHCADMPAAYALADIAVSASIEPEAFGRVAVEAQAMETPIIATAHGGSLETVLPGDTGWLVPLGEGHGIAEGLAAGLAAALGEALAMSAGARAEMGRKGRAHALANFTLEAMCARTLEVYRALGGGASAGSR